MDEQQIADPWKHRAKGMACSTCMWYVPKVGEVEGEGADACVRVYSLGRCRRHAPSMNGYPVVYQNDWCGDHKLDENKI